MANNSVHLNLESFINKVTGRSYPYSLFTSRLKTFAIKQKYPSIQTPTSAIDIVMLTFNRLADTRRTIESIYRETKMPFVLHLVDANSNDGTREYIQELSKQRDNIKPTFLNENLGVSGGRAKALETCEAEFVAYIDNDMVIMPGYFENLVAAIQSDPKVAGVQAKVVYPGGKIQINHPEFTETAEIINFLDSDSGKFYYDPTTLIQHECNWIPMGATLWQRKVLQEVKIDPEMLGSFEDNDFSYRVKAAGYKFLNCPSALVIHISAEYTPGAMNDRKYTEGRFHEEKTRKAAKRLYSKLHKVFVFGDNADKFAETLGFANFTEYNNYILKS